jgi:predicted phage terminase large subunit-like protein
MSEDFTREELELLLQSVDTLSEIELLEVEKMLEELDRRATLQAARDDLIAFCQYMDSNYKVGKHHRILADQLMAIEAGDKDRIAVNIPPRHGKSQLVSTYFPAWFIGRNPGKKVMLVSHTTDLAVDFGRKVRNSIDSAAYGDVFPGTALAADSKSAGRWNTTTGCEFYAAGVGSALAGRGADLLLVDDPHSEQDILNGNFTAFEKAYQWFAYGARTRLMPGGRVAIVHCMTGETPVLMADNTEKPLRDVRPGDMIGSYKDGELVSRKVLNWANQGADKVYTTVLSNGNLLRANARHPFLVVRDGVETWVKVRDLRTGDLVVSLRDAQVTVGQKPYPQCAKPAVAGSTTIKNIPAQTDARLGTREGGGVFSAASRAVPKRQKFTGCALSMPLGRIITNGRRLANTIALAVGEIATSNSNTASPPSTTTGCFKHKAGDAHAARNTPEKLINRVLGGMRTPLRSIIATLAVRSEPSYVTAAISYSEMELTNEYYSGPFSTSEIISITPDGVEDVFDIQVEDTENFIANFTVVSNTRWHSDDLTGRLIKDMANNEDSDQYEVIEFPAILEVEDKDTGEIVQRALWPEFFDLTALLRTKASMPVFQWNAQYQQNPTGEEAAIIKRDWWRLWPDDDPPAVEYIIMALDAAAEANNRADFTSLTTWGVFFNNEEDMHQIILLNAIKQRMEFPELKAMSMEEYKEWEPDAFIVEKKSSGTALYQEMRRAGVMVQEYTPVRGSINNPNSKMARLNSVSDIISSGLVWIPAKRWAEELVEEVAGFPFASNDDQVDTTIMALMRFRQGGFIRLPTDERDEEIPYRRKVDYY